MYLQRNAREYKLRAGSFSRSLPPKMLGSRRRRGIWTVRRGEIPAPWNVVLLQTVLRGELPGVVDRTENRAFRQPWGP